MCLVVKLSIFSNFSKPEIEINNLPFHLYYNTSLLYLGFVNLALLIKIQWNFNVFPKILA
jgi:hypothetical protein